MYKIKICGLKSEADITYVNEYKPDLIGFVFAEGRKRTIDDETASSLKAMLDPGIQAVGVFVDQPVEYVASLCDRGVIDAAQLHGNESEDYIKELKSLTDKPVIRAFVVREPEDIEKVSASSADMVLIDSGQGSGKRLDLSVLKDVGREYFLAGGLDPDSVAEIMADPPEGLMGLDVSSGVETDGVKDREKIRAFIECVRKY